MRWMDLTDEPIAMRRAWTAAAASLGFDLDEHPLRGLRIEGRAREVQVSAAMELSDSPLGLRVECRNGRFLPWGLRVAARGWKPGWGSTLRPVSIDNPILARFASAWSYRPERALELLSHPEVCGPLLGVIHQFPGSILEEDRVLVCVPILKSQQLKVALTAAIDASRALRGIPASAVERLRSPTRGDPPAQA